MTGRKVPLPFEHSILYMQFNEIYGKERKYHKKQAIKEDRRYLKSELKKELEQIKD